MSSVPTWEKGIALVRREWENLPEDVRDEIVSRIAELMICKDSIHRIMSDAGSGDLCAECGGLCCSRGKYHVSPIDLLAFIVTGQELFSPDFENGACPYLADDHCLMPPPYRPFTCITFACEAVEERIPPLVRARLRFLVDNLASLYASIDRILGRRVQGGLFHYVERHEETGEGILTP